MPDTIIIPSPSPSALAGGVLVPDFSKSRDLAAANTQALGLGLILAYYDSGGYSVGAPPQNQWNGWTVTKNMPPTFAGTYVMPGGQVGVMIGIM